MLNLLGDRLNKYEEVLSDAVQTPKANVSFLVNKKSVHTDAASHELRKLLLSETMKDGYTLAHLVSSAEAHLGPMTIILYGYHLAFACCGVFFGTGMLSAVTNFRIVPFFMSLAMATTALVSVTIMHTLIR